DLYRMDGGDIEGLGLEEYLFGRGVTVIEWFQFLPLGVVTEYLLLSLAITGAETRVLTLTAYGEQYEQMGQQLLTEQAAAGKGEKTFICGLHQDWDGCGDGGQIPAGDGGENGKKGKR